MKGIFSLVIVLIVFSCSRYDVNYDSQTKIIGHGGMGITHEFPINSFESLALCLNKGADGVEIDVQMTKDSILVAYHDEELSKLTTASGSIHNHNWNEIKNLEYSKRLYSEYEVIKLNDLFTNLPEFKDKKYFFDVKAFSPDTTGAHLQSLINQLVSTIKNFGLTNTTVEVRTEEIGLLVKQLDPSIEVFVYRNWGKALSMNIEYGFDGITTDVDLLTQNRIDSARAVNLKIAVVNTHSRERNDLAYVFGVDYNQTDMVSYVLRKKE